MPEGVCLGLGLRRAATLLSSPRVFWPLLPCPISADWSVALILSPDSGSGSAGHAHSQAGRSSGFEAAWYSAQGPIWEGRQGGGGLVTCSLTDPFCGSLGGQPARLCQDSTGQGTRGGRHRGASALWMDSVEASEQHQSRDQSSRSSDAFIFWLGTFFFSFLVAAL